MYTNVSKDAVLRLHVYDVGRCEKVFIVTCIVYHKAYKN